MLKSLESTSASLFLKKAIGYNIHPSSNHIMEGTLSSELARRGGPKWNNGVLITQIEADIRCKHKTYLTQN